MHPIARACFAITAAAIVFAAPPVRAEEAPRPGGLPVIDYQYKPLPVDGGGAIQHVAVSPHDPDLLLAAVDVGGIYRSTDGGESWSPAFEGLADSNFHFAVADVLFDPTDPSVAWAGTGKAWGSKDNVRALGGLWRSDDAGRSWVRVSSEVSFNGQYRTDSRQYGNLLWRDPAAPGRIVAGTATLGLRESTDGGKSWRDLLPGNEIGLITCVEADANEPGLILVGARESFMGRPYGIWRSEDDGRSFERVLPDRSIRSISISGDGSILAAGDGAFLSTDGGRTWQRHERGLPGGYEAFNFLTAAADPFTPGRFLMAGHPNGGAFDHPKVFVLQPRSRGWQAIDDPVDRAYKPYRPPGVGGWQGFVNWFAACPSSVVFHPTREGWVYLSDWYTVNRSTDGGRHWVSHPKGLQTTVPARAVWDARDPQRAYLGLMDIGAHEARLGESAAWVHSLRDRLGGAHAVPEQAVVEGQRVTLYQLYGYSGRPTLYVRREPPPERPDNWLDWAKQGLQGWSRVYQGKQEVTHGAVRPHMAVDSDTGVALVLLASGEWIGTPDVRATDSWRPYEDPVLSGIDSKDVLHVSHEGGRFVVQTEEGRTWLAERLGEWVAVEGWPRRPLADPTAAGRWYGLTDEGLVRSTDDGRSWTLVLQGPTEHALGADGTVYAFDDRKKIPSVWIARSTDGGSNWVRLTTPPGYPQSSRISPDPRDGSRFIYGGHGIGYWLATPAPSQQPASASTRGRRGVR